MLSRRQTDPTGGPPRDPALGSPVPAALLDLPFANDLRGIFRYEAGLLLDGYVTRLARMSGAIDRGLALRLMQVRDTRGFCRLGFSCFGDYVRQRVDLAERTAQEMVRLGCALQRLPLLDRALGDGRITWTAAMQVGRVAQPNDEAEWLRKAATMSVRKLKVAVDKARAPDRANDEGDDAEIDPQSNPEANDRCVKLSLLCSPRAARLWAAALELCRLTADAPISEAEACEYLLADFLSGTDPAADDLQVYPLHPPVKHGSRGQQSTHRPASHERPSDELGSTQVDLSSLKLSPETLVVFDMLEQDLPTGPFALDASVRALIAARRSLDLDLARLLRMFRQLGLARHVGFPSFTAYVEERLAISVHRANFLARLDRALSVLDATRQAIRNGKIGTVAALLISRVVDSDTERAWIERARGVTVLRLRKEVQWAERENAMRAFNTMPPSIGPLPSELQTLTVALLADSTSQAHPFEGASAWLRGEPSSSGDDTGRARGSNETACETFARDDASIDDAAGEAVNQAARVYREMFAADSGTPAWITIEFWLHESALSLWTESRRRLAAATGSRDVDDHQVLYDVALAFLLTHMPAWLEAIERGDPIAARDRFACQIPGCTMRIGSGHHLRFVSQLGPDESWNLLFLCGSHHILGIHGGGWIRVSGRAPDDLRAELGVDSEGVPLETWLRGQVAA